MTQFSRHVDRGIETIMQPSKADKTHMKLVSHGHRQSLLKVVDKNEPLEGPETKAKMIDETVETCKLSRSYFGSCP